MKLLLPKTCLVAIISVFILPLHLFAQVRNFTREYTEEHPLVYEDAWDLWPYTFLNDHGEPEGFNVDLVRMLCNELDIPYTIKLTSTKKAIQDLKNGQSDLMLGLDNRYEIDSLYNSHSIVQLFTHSVLTPKKRPVSIKQLADLANNKVIVHIGSLSHHLMELNGWSNNAIAKYDMKAAVQQISAEGNGVILWNTMSLKWLLRKFQIDNLKMTSVDMPYGKYRFISRDSILLSRLDKAYKKLGAKNNNYERLQNRWFYPELVESGIPSWVWYLTGTIGAIVFAMLLLYVLYRRQERKMTSLSMQNTQMLKQVLRVSHMHIWIHDFSTRTYTWIDAEGKNKLKNTSPEFSRFFTHDGFDSICEALLQLSEMKKQRVELELEAIGIPGNDKEQRTYSLVMSVLRWENNKPAIILGTMNDITDERKRQAESKTLLMRYKSIFETAMVDMLYYDKDGYLANLNKRAMHTFGMDLETALKLHINIREIVENDSFDFDHFEVYHTTRSMKVYNKFLPDSKPAQNNIYYELQFVPVHDENQELIGIYGTGYDVSEHVYNWRQQKENIKQLKAAYDEVNNYVNNINYAMIVGGVRTAEYSPQTHMLTIYNKLNIVEYRLTQSRCMVLVAEQSKNRATRLLGQMDNLTTNALQADILTNIRKKGMQIYLQVDFVPTFDEQGNVCSYFGLCRDVTDLKTTEQMLEKETVRAQEVEELKNSFLRNMSYEIRTPLNAVVGFAELFEQDHQQEDEGIFITEIKDNAAHLLRLINDILFLSRLDAHMIEINRQPTDFAKSFEAHCYAGWGGLQKKGVRYLTNNHYEQLIVNIDDNNLGIIINQITANAARYTESGTVRARYDYFDGKLMIIIEDTGRGIAESELEHIYERFGSSSSNGTGLGLPICKELVEQMGGYIDISSKVGKGTTIWIIIPCEATSMERKIEV